ncbi:MAG: bifunctional D-glycero-beta-D-manno-heptose-7-phosphate kinase/D-glycero-beta-D-manno-heptose 1-phosphate adenylyltransferase HldE [Gammaproteobacteria bacterium]|nr:bifunctional D-glycero-beta-D-manno-heptose-7-phosphate kinase/D-glycero-beta-D-manno-heptose 1-phosphate adenylyltransferase HldE [Gammaproteobacteria bacterium]MYF30592.1 bifunctional D-glycero-beta-D-manno-heptose-7-phosphate kinase/D-glycero-beta-D-manno-heptose 1-phosphate adenylyltransferase HldE [Gammaproteobacteria bacterium]MYK48451.1 bifunctional D-glycero-beta-D-manno-heptose-7-phosphate kinase/D-glycero-beta-D-manno-heptose 1-phosphate adenylyltransferase HldE [Gammaproteobacteria 
MNRPLPSAPDVHVLVVGDVMLDRYLYGRTERVSEEAPVPIVQVDGSEDRLGGAANVALNVVSLGAGCTLVGAVGDDRGGSVVAELLDAANVDADLVVVDGWRTTLKERVVSMRKQIARMDFEAPLAESVAIEVAKRVARHAGGKDAIVVEDYDKGAIDRPQRILAAAQGITTVVDPKFKPFTEYRGAALLKPNRRELRQALGRWPDDGELAELGPALARASGIDAIALTRGGDGLTLFESSGPVVHVPALGIDVYDSTGAGDTVAAAFGVCAARGWTWSDSARLANVAGALVCAKAGTAAVSLAELNAALRDNVSTARAASNRRQLAEAVARARRQGARIVFTNGCFDILHAGHVGYLDEARQLGDRLIVAINDDDSVRRLKGEGRPVNKLRERMRVLEGLAAVDWVVPFSEDTPEALLEEIRPDVLVKGGDYAAHEVVGGEFVRRYGGDVRVLSEVGEYSTTKLVEFIGFPERPADA